MYIPAANAVTDPDEIQALLRGLRLGCLVTAGPEGLYASHLPFFYDEARGVLAGHLARANPHRALAGDAAALAIFQGVDAYVSPSWYPSKHEHQKVVPTWNYEAVQVHGQLAWIDDDAWLEAHLSALTDRFESGRPDPWSTTDAPADYLRRLRGAVAGLELTGLRVEAKRKLSQNRDAPDREGVIAGLSASDSPGDRATAEAMRAVGGGQR